MPPIAVEEVASGNSNKFGLGQNAARPAIENNDRRLG
jgi:hypothetical protein